MLPDFPKIKRNLAEAANRCLEDLVRQEPLLSQIREERHFEGDRISSGAVNGESHASSYKEVFGKLSLDRDEIIAKGPAAFIESIPEIAEKIKKQKAQLFLEKLGEVADRSGSAVDGKGRPLTFDLFLEVLDKMTIEFDANGEPFMPTIFVPPELGAKLKQRIPEWDANPEYKTRFESLIKRKKEEWNDRESYRKLVD